MTIRAAGLLLLTPANRALFLKRALTSDHPGEWCLPGGCIEPGETAQEAAERELREEVGDAPHGDPTLLTRRVAPDYAGEAVDFTTFKATVDGEFIPTLNEEHTAWCWASITDPPQPLHPGCQIALARPSMDELGVARAIAAGELSSPQLYENVSLFAIRITGTGAAYRNSLDEACWRDPSIYLTDEFLARCNGLTVVWVHPKSLLNSAEFADRVIGSIMLPYISGDEVWGIAKIYDDEAIAEMSRTQLSTSPGVNFADPSVNTTVTTDDGQTILVEDKPSLLDHIAVLPEGMGGVWDKSGPPTGVRLDAQKELTTMTDEEKKAAEAKEREDAARRDAESSNIDKLLSKLDAMTRRLDAMEEEKKADAKARRDAERESWMKADAAACERDDAEEEKGAAKYKADGMDEEAAMDKARKDRRDAMKARSDAEEGEKGKEEMARAAAAEKAKEDREKADRRDAQVRADAIAADTRALAERIANMPMSPSDAGYTVMLDAQAAYDPAYQAFGLRAPAPMQSEAQIGYRRRLARGLQAHSPDWKGVDLALLPDTALAIAEQRIRQDAVVASRSTAGIEDGVLIPIVRTNPDTGHRITEFRGRTTIFKQFAQPALRATKFLTAKGA